MNLLPFLFLLMAIPGASQLLPNNAAATPAAASFPAQQYQQSNVAREPLYNGMQHYGYAATMKGHAYFMQNEWSNGTVVYQNKRYDDVSLRLDLNTGQLIVRHPTGASLNLLTEWVTSFNLQEQSFILINTHGDKHPEPAFYRVLIDHSKVNLFARDTKTVSQHIVDNVVITEFIASQKYYTERQGVYTLIDSPADIYKIAGPQKKEIKKFLRRQDLRFKDEKERTILEAINHLNTISQPQ